MKLILPSLICALLLFTVPLSAQTKGFVIPDSLKGKTYEELKKRFEKSMDHFDTANLYAQTYLKKAEKQKEYIQIFNGLNMLIQLNTSTQEAVKYCDQLIQLGETYQNDTCMAEGYYQKGGQLYYLSNYKESFENYLKANEIFKKKKMVVKQLDIKHGIGLLKNEMNQPREALVLFRNNFNYYSERTMKTKYPRKYLITLLALTDAYNRLEIQDSSAYYSALGIEESLRKDPSIYPHFLVSYGISKYHAKAYQNSLDTLLKGVHQFPLNNTVLCDTYLVISDNYVHLKKTLPSIQYLKKIDSIFEKDPSVYSQALGANKKLLDYYTDQHDSNLQLKTAHKILVLDSIAKKNNENVSQQIVTEYEIPIILDKKNHDIQKLINTRMVLYASLILISIGVLVFALYNHRRQKKFRESYNVLIDKITTLEVVKVNAVESVKQNDKAISNETMDSISKRLHKFEMMKEYRNNNINLITLAKDLQTNTTYLSKYFNQNKNISFPQYLNELRINDAIATLKKDSKIRNYTIKAIAEYFGFNNSESFAKAFYSKTGIYPSYYIKTLNNDTNL